MAVSLRRDREALRGRYTPNLWPVWIVAPVALIAAGALGWVIYHYAYDHFAQAAADQEPPKPVNINDPLKATVAALTLIGAVLAGLHAYRKQLLAEARAPRLPRPRCGLDGSRGWHAKREPAAANAG
ncbi:hypothetical protein [Streptomyces sp. NPDC055105]|uniref:hypothetical protein n=1 Tax=Streptomyces sp. NPDC055105 TaxID=3365719 RepID=UPI0037CD1E4B